MLLSHQCQALRSALNTQHSTSPLQGSSILWVPSRGESNHLPIIGCWHPRNVILSTFLGKPQAHCQGHQMWKSEGPLLWPAIGSVELSWSQWGHWRHIANKCNKWGVKFHATIVIKNWYPGLLPPRNVPGSGSPNCLSSGFLCHGIFTFRWDSKSLAFYIVQTNAIDLFWKISSPKNEQATRKDFCVKRQEKPVICAVLTFE